MMENKIIELETGLLLELNDNEDIAIVKSSPDIEKTDILTIPRFVQHENKKYKVISIEYESFEDNLIGYLNFEEDVEIESFNSKLFNLSKIKKLQIPASLKYLENGWCIGLTDIDEIKLSPQNKNFQLINTKYLIGKSNQNNSKYDILHFICKKLDFISPPPQIEMMKKYSFENCKDSIYSLTFTDDSKIKIIENQVLNGSCITKLVLPASIESIDSTNWDVKHLNEIKISPKNENYKLIENQYLCTKSEGSEIFDTIVFAPRNIEYIKIPSNIKIISKFAFAHCRNIIEFSFESNSSLELIDEKGFYDSAFPDDLILPESLKTIGNNAFELIGGIDSVQFLSETIKIMTNTFYNSSVKQFSFPNAKKITLEDSNLLFGVINPEITVHKSAEINTRRKKIIKSFINYSDSEVEDTDLNEKEIQKKDVNDEDNFNIIDKICEDSKSICYKVYDKLKKRFIFRKIFKVNNDDSVFKKISEAKNKLAYLQSIQHPYICQAYAMDQSNEGVIFDFEFNNYNLKELIRKLILSDNLKVKIAFEIAAAMKYANSKKTYHGNLYIDNIMLSDLFEVKIINFGFQNLVNLTMDSLIFVAPEILNDNHKLNQDQCLYKIDVYSYGIILYMLFFEKEPKLTLSEKKSGKLPEFPKKDSSITDFSTDLIKKCLSFEPSNRPSFEGIITMMENNFSILLRSLNL